MNKDQLVAVLLTKEEIYTLRSMCHDSSTYWHNLWQKAVDGENNLTPEGCLTVIDHRKKLEEKMIEIMYATHPELADAVSKEEEQEEDKVLETV